LAPAKALFRSLFRDPRAEGAYFAQDFGPALLHPEILRDFGYDPDLLGRDEVDEKALFGLTGVLRTGRKSLAGRMFLNLDAFAPPAEWEFISKDAREGVLAGGSNDIQLHAD
jgi:hypothetical protein